MYFDRQFLVIMNGTQQLAGSTTVEYELNVVEIETEHEVSETKTRLEFEA